MNLDENVIKALEFFIKNPPPVFNIDKFNLPFVVGSGNAYNTGTIIFSQKAAIFADESNFTRFLEAYGEVIKKGIIKDAVIISASGEKDSVWEAETAKNKGLKTTLLTTKELSSAAKIADNVLTFKSIAEPYTYNVSTYMGMILSSTKEDPEKIKSFLDSDIKLPENFFQYESYAFILNDNFTNICPMLEIKRHELFGPNLSLRAFSAGHARHAKFVNRSEKELVISLGVNNQYFGFPKHRLNLNLPPFFSFAGVMALTYYLIGKIQGSKHPFYKENIGNYCADYGPKAYSPETKPFQVIVPGSGN